MNNQRRKDIQTARDLIEQAHDIIQYCAEEERQAYDNLPESIQYSDRGYKMEENADNLDDLESNLYDILNSIDENFSD